VFLRKPKSLLEHEVAMAQYTQKKRTKDRKSLTSKATKHLDGKEREEAAEEDDSKDYEMKDRSKDFPPTSRTHSDYLDENFIRSFLSGRLCLRGVRTSYIDGEGDTIRGHQRYVCICLCTRNRTNIRVEVFTTSVVSLVQNDA